jgi:hypothetical protein
LLIFADRHDRAYETLGSYASRMAATWSAPANAVQ